MMQLAPDLALPTSYVTKVGAVCAKRGAGKTHNTAVIVEELAAAGAPVCVIDPVGVWWGLRSGSDGESAGLPFVVLGGAHGHLPLDPSAGKAVAEYVAAEPRLMVLDLSGFESKAEQNRFVTAFCDRLYVRNRRPLHVVLEEAAEFAPQKPMQGEQLMLNRVERMVRLGRQHGIGVTMVTQRPAILHKNVLTQADVLIAMRMTGALDKKAIHDWIDQKTTDEANVLATLSSLETGEAWVWEPESDLLKRTRFRKRWTFDSSRTPELGDAVTEPTAFAQVDLDDLQGRGWPEVLERAQAQDPDVLQRRIRELERRLRERSPAEPVRVEVEVPVLDETAVKKLGEVVADLERLGQLLAATATEVGTQLQRAVQVSHARDVSPAGPAPRPSVKPVERPGPSGGPVSARLPKSQAAILGVLAQQGRPLRATQIALLTGYSSKGGGFNNAISALRSARLIEGGRDAIKITDAGVDAAGDVPALPTGPALIEHWLSQLGKAERAILVALVEAWPGSRSAQELADITDYSAAGGGFNNALSRLRSLELARGGRDAMYAADELGQAAAQ